MKSIVITSLCFLMLLSACKSTVDTESIPSFELVQSELFSQKGSMTNAWADMDNDGDLDLFVGFGPDQPNRLYRNVDGQFSDVAAEVGIADMEGTRAVAWGDYNADGHLDLYVGFSGGSQTGPSKIPNKLYRNDGEGRHFTDVTQSLGIGLPLGLSRQVNWIDYDNDGDVDLFVGFRDLSNVLFRNEGGRFTDVSKKMGLMDSSATMGATMGGVWFDFDLDGDLDLYLANMDGYANRLYRNDQTRFVDVAPELGLDGGGREINPNPGEHSMAGTIQLALVDFDNDGDLDIFVTNLGGPDGFYRNNGDSFVNVAPELGLAHEGYRGTAAWADFNNDGWIDLYANGTLYRNDKAIFKSVTPEIIQKNVGGYGSIWADSDGNGAMDLTISSRNHYIIHNLLPLKQASNCLKVMVLDENGHHSRAGTEIRLFTSSSKKLIGARIVETNSGYNAQSVMPEHFGLPTRELVDVEITSMTNNGRKTARLNNIDPSEYSGNYLTVQVDSNGKLVI